MCAVGFRFFRLVGSARGWHLHYYSSEQSRKPVGSVDLARGMWTRDITVCNFVSPVFHLPTRWYPGPRGAAKLFETGGSRRVR